MTMKREHFCSGEYCQCKTYWTSESDFNDDGEFVAGWTCNNCGRWEPKRVQRRNYEAHTKPNRSQQSAIERLRRYIESDFSAHEVEEYGKAIVEFDIKPTGYDYGFWVFIHVDLPKLGEGNLLRALDQEYWHVYIGPKGRIDAHSYPDVYKRLGYDKPSKKHYSGINFK